MNDRLETRLGRKIVYEELFAMGSHPFDMELSPGELGKTESYDRLFLACFSERRDELSLWRNYAPDSGYAIAFKKDALEEAARRATAAVVSSAVELLEVLYDEAAFRDAVRGQIESKTGNDEVTIHSLYRFSSALKHPRWQEEAEWRLATVHHTFCTDDHEPCGPACQRYGQCLTSR